MIERLRAFLADVLVTTLYVIKPPLEQEIISVGWVIRAKVTETHTETIFCETKESFDNVMLAFPDSEYMEVFTVT